MIQKLKKSNAGFTLVELIVVIAILGVLAAVLVPQYIQYVEQSRVAVDDNYIAEVGHAAEILSATTEGAGTGTYTIAFTADTGAYTVTAGTGGSSAVATALQTDIADIVPVTAFRSNTYGATAPGSLTLTGGIIVR